ncbi:MAG: rRNA small subunit methyltransferase 1 [Oligoflexia bacterium]|nr:rRNA small subunit methyltransferase 1 [Oligoflexia bacterium]
MSGILYLLSVDIGNVNDLTFRAYDALKNGKYFVVEDTRVFSDLLQRIRSINYNNGRSSNGFNDKYFNDKYKEEEENKVKREIISFHDHSEEKKIDKIISILKEENDVYLLSDAGNPIISDPAYPLIEMSLKNEIEIKSIPGVSSILVALELSGLPPYPFHFFGFFPRENDKQTKIIDVLEYTDGTFIFFESGKRLIKTVEFLVDKFPFSSLCICRELTKKFETVHRFNANEWNNVRDNIVLKGEFCLLVNVDHFNKDGVSSKIRISRLKNKELKSLAQEILDTGIRKKTLAKLLASILDISNKDTYQQLNKHQINNIQSNIK